MLNKEELTKIKPILGPERDAKKRRGKSIAWAEIGLMQRSAQKKQCGRTQIKPHEDKKVSSGSHLAESPGRAGGQLF